VKPLGLCMYTPDLARSSIAIVLQFGSLSIGVWTNAAVHQH
jgi:hypothetical protein